ncbi:asparagine synthase-related protein [Thermopolyspora sp. NPDC052614]|uniref:asparagine synthase-related protein n=1 Tax=Thermopolyspora sp. NPDC052614 TaxID=3155682 RepID=UPI0034464287
MRVYLAVAAKHPRADLAKAVSAAKAVMDQVFPVPMETVTGTSWVGPDTALLAWSNEGDVTDRPPLLDRTENRALGICGNISFKADVGGLAEAASLLDKAQSTAGCFSAFKAERGRVQGVTSSTRACPVFYAENSDFHVIGSRALHVHLVANKGRIQSDEIALQTMIRQGYFLSDETPYSGVSALPPSAAIRIDEGRRTITEIPLPVAAPMPSSKRARRAAIAEVADALIAAVEPLRSAPEPVNLALTGGRDSRLMAALLHAAGIPFRATTNGFDTAPDVVIARLIARKLRIDHTVIPPEQTERKDAVVIPHPLERTYEVLRTCEGMTSAYESIVEYLPYSRKPTMSGQSGEILRGGFLYSQGQTTDKAMKRRVNDFFLKQEDLFTDDANAHARELARPWLARAEENAWEVLDHMYVVYRVGRWHASARAGSLRRGDAVQPFLDNRFVARALTLDQRWRHSEQVVYELIRHFAPGLEKIQLEGTPWRFSMTEQKPRGIWPWSNKGNDKGKAPKTGSPSPKKAGAAWNWRTSPGPVLSALLRDYVLERADLLSRLVRPEQLKAVFAAPSVAQPALAWNLYTVAALLSDTYPGPPPAELEPVRVEIPKTQ